MTLAILIVAALVTSTISGFLGMAGGVTLVGVMTLILPAEQVVPIHGVVQLASNFTRTLAYLKHVAWRIFLVYALPMALGAAAAAWLWKGGKMPWFKPVIGVYLLTFLAWRRFTPKLHNPPLWSYAPLGAVTGFLTLYVGATGPFIAPFFLRDDFEKEEVIATKAVCQAWGHLLKLPAFLALGFDYTPHLPTLAALLVCVVAGTFAGKALLKRISKQNFVRIFEGVLGLLALGLLFG